MPESVTTRSIAAAAGVGQSTVSMALRNDPRIPEATRRRIQETAIQLGYRPNALISKLMAGVKSRRVRNNAVTLAYVIDWENVDTYYQYAAYRQFREGAQARASNFGYIFEDFILNPKNFSPVRLNKILRTRAIPGMLIAPVQLSGQAASYQGLELTMECRDYAISTIGYSIVSPRLHRVTHDHSHGIQLACKKLQEHGYKRIGFAFGNSTHVRVEGRWLSGYLLAQQDLPASNRIPYLMLPNLGDFGRFQAWLDQYRPDAILAAEYSVFQAFLERAGLRIPDDIGLAHLDLASTQEDRAGIEQHSRELGAAAFDLLLAQIHRNETGVPALPKTIMLEGRWIDGPSIRNLAASQPERKSSNGKTPEIEFDPDASRH